MNEKWMTIYKISIDVLNSLIKFCLIIITLHMCVNYSLWWILLLLLNVQITIKR